MHPRALPLCFVLQTRAFPADAERIVHSVALDAHDPPAGWAANRDRVRAEAVANMLRPDDVLNLASSDFGEPATVGTGDHKDCLAANALRASGARRTISRQPPVRMSGTSTLCTQTESVQPQVVVPLQWAGATSPTSSTVAT